MLQFTYYIIVGLLGTIPFNRNILSRMQYIINNSTRQRPNEG